MSINIWHCPQCQHNYNSPYPLLCQVCILPLDPGPYSAKPPMQSLSVDFRGQLQGFADVKKREQIEKRFLGLFKKTHTYYSLELTVSHNFNRWLVARSDEIIIAGPRHKGNFYSELTKEEFDYLLTSLRQKIRAEGWQIQSESAEPLMGRGWSLLIGLVR